MKDRQAYVLTLARGPSVVQDDIEQRTVDFQTTFILDKAQFAEPVHEKADSGAGSADDLCQCLLANPWNHRLGFAGLPEVGQKKEHPR